MTGIHAILTLSSVNSEKPASFKTIEALYEDLSNEEFGQFMNTENFDLLKENGLLFL